MNGLIAVFYDWSRIVARYFACLALATRIVEMTPAGINIFPGNYEDFLAAEGLAA